MITRAHIQDCLNNTDKKYIESLARQARDITRQYFGRTISLYAPIYLSNYCSSHCTYCGFNSHNRIKRYKLTEAEMHQEMGNVAQKGIENILLLTGESYQATPLAYLETAVNIAKSYFPCIALEVHPMEQEEYRDLFKNGVDGITLYQETYNLPRYLEVHLSGKKRDYRYRRQALSRAAQAGIRHISLGVLLGLFDVDQDLLALYEHLREMERSFPGVEYSLSFPRLRPIQGQTFYGSLVDDVTLIKIICLTRILFPRVGINLSTRECASLRDHAIEIGVTRLSAESSTIVGGYTLHQTEKDAPQFDVQDKRSVQEIIQCLKQRNFDPILTDWRRIPVERAGAHHEPI
jgi:2-iminoacetate synthase